MSEPDVIHENDLTDAQWKQLMDKMAVQGFLIFITFGIYSLFAKPIEIDTP